MKLQKISRFEAHFASMPCVLSIVLLAGGVEGKAAIRSLIAIIFATSVLITINRFRTHDAVSKPASTALILGFVFWYAYPAVISYFIPGYALDMAIFNYASDRQIIESLALLSLYLFTLIVISGFLQRNVTGRKLSQTPSPPNFYSRKKIFLLAAGACLIGASQYFVFGLGTEAIKSAIIESRGSEKPWFQLNNLGNSTSPFTFVATSAMLAGSAALWLMSIDRNARRSIRILSVAVALITTIILYFDQGTRANLAIILSPMLTVRAIRFWKNSRMAVIGGISVAILLGIVILQFQTLYRSPYTRELASRVIFKDWYTLGRTIDYFGENVFAVCIVPSGHNYFKEINLVHFLVSPIPRFLWPSKPVSEVIRFYTLQRWDIDIVEGQGNTFPGIVGQYYMSWGWLGPLIIGTIFGWLARRIDSYFAAIRGSADIYRMGMGILVISWMVLCYRVLSPAYLYPISIFAIIVGSSRKAVVRAKQVKLPKIDQVSEQA